MTATATFLGFYRGAINLWVEDPLTRDYLRELWQGDPSVVFYIGGGADGIQAVLKEAETAGLKNVFAYADRDFRPSNRAHWLDPQKTFTRFVTSVHEIENFLLDADALAACDLNTGNRSAAEVHTQLQQRASELIWWMACRGVISGIHAEFYDDFPVHPKCPAITDQAGAETYVLASPWFSGLAARTAGLSAAEVRNRLANTHARAVEQIADGSWQSEFSGKELFRHVRGYVYTNASKSTAKAVLDADLAKSVGRWQVDKKRVPQEIDDLLKALKARASRP
ncbi:MAG: hypothetical protein ACLQNE_38370 [Thermoguttaceae bacterium]